MHEITTFQYHTHEFRTLQDGEQLIFVAKDVCQAMELDDVSNACKNLPEQEKLIRTLFVSGQARDMLCVTESGLYRLIFRSNKPEAEVFRTWVFSEVLPTIRKTGSYVMPGAANSAMDAMAGQIIAMVTPAVINQVMGQVTPLVDGIKEQVAHIQINFSHCGTVWSFHYHCCQKGNTNTYIAKDELYAAYCAYCATIPYCRPEGKTAFLTKIYRAYHNTGADHVWRHGKKVPAVRGMALLPGWEQIIEDKKEKRRRQDAQELARRRVELCGVRPEDANADREEVQ